jgi:hypothetical protein
MATTYLQVSHILTKEIDKKAPVQFTGAFLKFR